MGTFLYALGIIILGLCIGKVIRWLVESQRLPASLGIGRILKLLVRFVLLGINPLILIGAFWIVDLSEFNLIYLPILGVTTIILGGLLGIAVGKLLKLNRAQTGSLFVSGAFVNLGSFGTLFCFLLFGEASLAFVALFRIFEEFVYYTVAFPIAKAFGTKQGEEDNRSVILKILKDPFIIVSFTAIVIGGCLNLSSLERPIFYGHLNQTLVPISTLLLLIPIGFSMNFKSVKGYLRESFFISAIKFVIVPGIITTMAFLFGMGEMHNGMVLGVILVLSAMPPAVSSLIPPQLFKLDVDLANSSWLLNTALLFIVLPILYFVVQLF
ncbi:AEC family transporter [Halalkalibacter kiskunsagensis]|uniref:AEC family transporter n=1 Tax=Halalkalibacter kiskunsagensis TaxID=1548599 RepID=A0ABV6KDE0_9BACI